MIKSFSTIQEAFDAVAVRFPNKIAVQLQENNIWKRITFQEMVNGSKSIAKKLQSMNIVKGDRVILISENRPEAYVAMLSVLYAGATAVVLDPSLSDKELNNLIEYSDARGILVSHKPLSKIDRQQFKTLPIMNIQNDFNLVEGSVLKNDNVATPDPMPEIAAILYTSGTSGIPKGVMLSNKGFCVTMLYNAQYSGAVPDDRTIALLPFFHVAALASYLCYLHFGVTVTCIEKIDAAIIAKTFSEIKPTHLVVVPRILELFYTKIKAEINSKKIAKVIYKLVYLCGIVRKFTKINLGPKILAKVHHAFGGELRFVACGAAALDSDIHTWYDNAGFTIVQGYGLTETFGAFTANRINDRRAGTVGWAWGECKTRIDSPNQNGVGEICIGGPMVMSGYFRNPQITAEVLKDGWFYSGDVGSFDKNGRLIISGRIKDIIVTNGGKKSAPYDIEQMYKNVPGIKEISVLGISSKLSKGDEIHAAVVIAENISAESVISEINKLGAGFPYHQRVQKVHVFAELPKTSTMKVKRFVLQDLIKQRLEQGKQEAAVELKTEKLEPRNSIEMFLFEEIKSMITSGHNMLNVRTSLTDFGMDSIMITDLLSRIENNYKIVLKPDDVITHSTIESLAKLLEEKGVTLSAQKELVQAVNSDDLVETTNIAPVQDAVDQSYIINLQDICNRVLKNHQDILIDANSYILDLDVNAGDIVRLIQEVKNVFNKQFSPKEFLAYKTFGDLAVALGQEQRQQKAKDILNVLESGAYKVPEAVKEEVKQKALGL